MLKGPFLVVDLETVPDGDLLAAARYPGETPEKAIALAFADAKRASQDRSDFIPLPFHRPICLGLMTLGEKGVTSEVIAGTPKTIAKTFWALYSSVVPVLVSYNGRGFDLPLLELTSFRERLTIPDAYWGKYGPRNRFGDGHIDLQEFLNNSGAARMFGGLDVAAKMLGRAGKSEVDGSRVYTMYREGKLDDIKQYCLDDVKDTAAVFLRTRVMTGTITPEQEADLLRQF